MIPTDLQPLLMEDILHQLRLVVHPIIYKVLAPSQVVGLGISEPSTSYHFSPEDVGSSWSLCQPCLVGHSLVVGWGGEKSIIVSGFQGCWKYELTNLYEDVLGGNLCVYTVYFLCVSNVQYVLWFMILFSFFLPCLCPSQNLFVHCFPILETLAPRTKTRWQVLSTLDMKNMKRDPGIIVGFLAHGFDGGNLEVEFGGFFIVSLVEFFSGSMEGGSSSTAKKNPRAPK